MRVQNFLDISLLKIWETFSRNFIGYLEDVPYVVLLVEEYLEVINCSRPKLLPAATQRQEL
jgi:hypothetical protein